MTTAVAISQGSLQNRLRMHLTELHLPTVKEVFDEAARMAEAEHLSYEQYLLHVVERECEVRRTNRIGRILRGSGLPLEKTFEIFKRERLPRAQNAQLTSLLDGSFLDRKENLLVFGRSGSGKTHLLCALAHELIQTQERKIRFTTCSLLVQELLLAKRELKLARYLKRMAHYDGLIIDEVGYIQQSRDEMEVLFTLLADRYERGSVMLTSNLPFSQWSEIFKDPTTTAAAIDRLVHHSVIIELNLDSYRLAESELQHKREAQVAPPTIDPSKETQHLRKTVHRREPKIRDKRALHIKKTPKSEGAIHREK
jgi:DNA replication protein DnaC